MAKALKPSADAQSVNNLAPSVPDAPPINAVTPENTPVPGGGRWSWDYPHACWVETHDEPAPVTPFPTLE